MNLKQLEAFVQVAEKKSFSKAAKELFLTQPTVSAHVSALEKELKARLFNRNTKEVELSREGKMLFTYAKEMVALEEQIKQIFLRSEEEDATCITIAASTIPFQYVLPRVLARFSERHPKDKFEVIESDSADVIGRVAARQIEIGFTGTMIPKANCTYIPFFEDELVIITPNTERFQQMKKNGITMDIFRNEPIIMREVGSGTRMETEKYLKSNGINLEQMKVVASMENTEAIKRSVGNGLGIAILSALAVEKEAAHEEVLKFSFPGERMIRNLYVVQNKNQTDSLATSRFIHLVQEEYAGDGLKKE